MKTLIAAIYTTILVFASIVAFAQTSEPQKKNNVIQIETIDNSEVAIKNLVGILGESGFAIHSVNKDYGTITTTPKLINQNSLVLNVAIKDSGEKRFITLWGNFDTGNMPGLGQNSSYKTNVFYGAIKGSPLGKSWALMHEIAKSYPNGIITYLTK